MLPKIQGLFKIQKKETIETQNGGVITTLTLMTSEKYKDNQTFCWITGKIFGKRAEAVNQYFDEKDDIFITGKLTQENWEKDGVKQSRHVLIIEDFAFVNNKANKEKTETTADEEMPLPF
jgi:single-strand DNA-binding protein